MIFHIEIQTTNNHEMLYRMLRYLVETHKEYKKPVYQILIYIGKSKLNMENSLCFKFAQESGIDYRYKIINFEELTIQDILNLGTVEILPVLTLAKIKENPEEQLKNITEIILEKTKDLDFVSKKNLLLKTEILSGIKYPKDLIEKIFREVIKMVNWEESAGYQLILERGIEKGIEKGIERGIEKGKDIGIQEGIEKLRSKIIEILKKKFNIMPVKISEELKKISTFDQLDIAFTNALECSTLEEFLKTLE